MRKSRFYLYLLSMLVLSPLFVASGVQACGHEGFYFGGGYSQLFLWSQDKQIIGGGLSNNPIRMRTRFGAYGKIGYDFCQSRMGIEFPFAFDRQRLNRVENVSVFSADTNAVIHLIETEKGADFYWIIGTGFNMMTEGSLNNNSRARGINANFGPGFQYFLSKGATKAAIGISVPVRYTFYFGNNLSRDVTKVLGFPIHVGFTVGF